MSTAVLPEAEAYFSGLHIQLQPALPMTTDQFFDFCQQNRKLRIERTATGDLVIMPPSSGGTGKRNLSIGAQLYNWAERDRSGEAYDSSTGFILPIGAVRSPDASWVLKSRLATLTEEQREKFIPLCPDFLVELMSPTDSLAETQAKMQEYLENGMRLGWLIDRKRQQIHIYRPGQDVSVIDAPPRISGDPELPGFLLDLKPVW
jgi:Uma2 family endonuclease